MLRLDFEEEVNFLLFILMDIPIFSVDENEHPNHVMYNVY